MNSNSDWASKLQQIVEECYPGNWDYHTNSRILYILFPKITVTNDLEMEHTITDLYVKLSFTSSGTYYGIAAVRGTVTQAERESGYGFSHLTTVSAQGGFGTFCFGQGPITAQIRDLQRILPNHADYEVKMTAFLLALETYLSYESIEGIPYCYITDIKRRLRIDSVEEHIKKDTYDRFINVCKRLNFNIVNNKRLLVNYTDDDFLDALVPLVKPEYLVERDQKGQFFTASLATAYQPVKLGFTFKGEQVYQKVLVDESNNDTGKKYPHPDIAKYVAEKLSRRLTLHALAQRDCIARSTNNCTIAGIMVQDM